MNRVITLSCDAIILLNEKIAKVPAIALQANGGTLYQMRVPPILHCQKIVPTATTPNPMGMVAILLFSK